MWRKQLLRSIALAFAGILPFFLTVFGSYIVGEHTRDGRLAMWVILHSQTMTDQQLAHAIGEDPFAVLRRSSMMMKAITPTVAILVGCFVALLMRKKTGRTVALVLTPYFLWDFYMSAFAKIRTPTETLLEIAGVLGTNGAYIIAAVVIAVSVARLLPKRLSFERASF
jgi:hypothetical protein